ncbi:UDP-glycosyltransferase UGT5-like isoform X2 [Diabrotica virgifera virgifera]|uniref:UDP-glucuronosyltransferase n=1 Tax=Diabrotica virgifera virgifera TaxID=50390 RepID=A0ABM5K5N8_DIAVI|nr:UDP-glycosyltransferase UGT5-like isoform X2 [Diabrotica virgifera virgifera]
MMLTLPSRFVLILIFCLWCTTPTKCAKIIGVFPVFGRSHHILAIALMRGLADAGHDVTIVCSYEDNYSPKRGSYRTVILEGFAEEFASSFNFVNRLVGNPTIISYTPQLISTFRRPMCLQDRIYNTILYTVEEIMNHFLFLPTQDKLIHKYFPDSPSVYDLTKNVSLVLVNSHETMWQAVPLVPNVISIGGFHVKPPKKLPEDLQAFLDSAKEGVIFFSMGSNLKSKDLPKDKMNVLIKVFGSLKQKVLWKLESDVEGLPSNIRTGKWLPQMDILAHPNVVLFITHGGLLSMTETIYNGVPVLVIPVFGDQAYNGNNAVYAGFGLSIFYHDQNFTEERFGGALNELLTNTSYKLAALRHSKAFHDRPMKPLDVAVYWVNYVIDHNGAQHLRVDGLYMPWYQYLLLDVIIILISILTISIALVIITLRCLFKSKNKNVKLKQS